MSLRGFEKQSCDVRSRRTSGNARGHYWLFATGAAISFVRSDSQWCPRRVIAWCRLMAALLALALALPLASIAAEAERPSAAEQFRKPPDSARPWVYWFWMDGNSSREGITADLEAMRRSGIGGVLWMEVDVGIPRGQIEFMSPKWKELFCHAVRECERLGLELTTNVGPGWTGSGGPWVKPEQSMQHLVSASVDVTGPAQFDAVLPRPKRRPAYFGESGLPESLRKSLDAFYADVAVLAFPTPEAGASIADLDEKALYVRDPYSSKAGTKPCLPAAPSATATRPAATKQAARVDPAKIIDLTKHLQPGGRLRWTAPPGRWTIVRFGRTSTGSNTRPAPVPGIGLECDKFDPAALDAHFDRFVGELVRQLGPRPANRRVGWTTLHIDSWEMGAQNWTASMLEQFRTRRGYDPTPYLPAFAGHIVGDAARSERFLWDLRQTANELIVERHAEHLKRLARRYGLGLSIEPYDMNPAADLSLGGVADVPMGEFWAAGYGFNTAFACLEAASIGHTRGRPVVAAEAFTSDSPEAWRLFPAAMKNQGDWAFTMGINRFVVHRYAHQPWLDRWPGMTMGPYGVHYERTQTWWEMSRAWHAYLARCQHMLRQGVFVADVCYMAPEGAPTVFRAPSSALAGVQPMPERRGYTFDGCAPEVVLREMTVRDGRLTLPGGASYAALVLPDTGAMRPELLRKIRALVEAGATVVGTPPAASPSLTGYPQCDQEVQRISAELWGPNRVGRGRVIRAARSAAKASRDEPSLPAEAKWIWNRNENPMAAPPCSRLFRFDFRLDAGVKIVSARLRMTADNAFRAEINGQPAGEGNNFTQVAESDVTPLLRAGENRIAVAADNGGDNPNPAGLIGALEIRTADGRTRRIVTDKSWQSALAAGSPWQPAVEIGPYGCGPWGTVGVAAPEPINAELYPAYDVVASALRASGIVEDFASTGKLRFAHRRDGRREIYFVANRTGQWVDDACVFRVAGKTPTLWDPATGRIWSIDDVVSDGRTTHLPLRLEPYGSVFVVFDPASSADLAALPAASGRWPGNKALAEIRGPWEVRFQPGRGAPAHIALPRLIDLAKHDDAAVRHFSGAAIYRTTFSLPADATAGPLWLDLGRVEVMAEAKLNGRPLGIAWKTPFAVDATGAVRPGENVLEVSVANLWPNRLIGDAGLPPEKRVSWTTWNPYRKDSPLLPSGLIGPVTLRATSR